MHEAAGHRPGPLFNNCPDEWDGWRHVVLLLPCTASSSKRCRYKRHSKKHVVCTPELHAWQHNARKLWRHLQAGVCVGCDCWDQVRTDRSAALVCLP